MADSRRIDIYLQFNSGEIVAIENKPWAGDQENQLGDYAEYIKREAQGKNWLLIYLCNSEPSEKSLNRELKQLLEEDGCFLTITFYELVDWMERCAKLVKAPAVKVFVDDLVGLIRRDVNGELDMSEQNEIKQILLKSTSHLQSAFHVQKVMHSIKEELLSKFKDDLEYGLHQAGFGLIWDRSMSQGWKSYSGFGVKFGPNHNIYLLFEFASSNLQGLVWGLRRKDDHIPRVDEIWAELNSKASSIYGAGRNLQWWPWQRDIDQTAGWTVEDKNWGTNFEPWMKIQSGELVDKVIEMSKRVWEVLESESKQDLLAVDAMSIE
jgi:hypothetical protein